MKRKLKIMSDELFVQGLRAEEPDIVSAGKPTGSFPRGVGDRLLE
jgi:hypothetical protein